jgi:hypothetical protein
MYAYLSPANPAGILTLAPQPPTHPPGVFPQVVSAATAVQRLRSIQFIPARDAVAQLGVWLESSRILHLYQKYFPRQFACSTASDAIPIQPGDAGYSMLELEFFHQVDQHLFPLPELFFDMERHGCIPLYPQGIDWEDQRDDRRLSLRAAMALVSDDDAMLWEAWLPPHLRPISGERDWEHFAELCRREKGFAARFPLLLDFVGLDTGNIWLDSNWEGYWENYPWEESAMEYLKKEWRQAQRIFAQLNPLLDRMDKHPRYWLKRLVRLWNSAMKTPIQTSTRAA